MFGKLILFGEQLRHLTVATQQHGVKADDLAILVERDAVNVFDKPVGACGRRGSAREQGEGDDPPRKKEGEHPKNI